MASCDPIHGRFTDIRVDRRDIQNREAFRSCSLFPFPVFRTNPSRKIQIQSDTSKATSSIKFVSTKLIADASYLKFVKDSYNPKPGTSRTEIWYPFCVTLSSQI